MKKQFSIFDNPFSDETKKLRLNCLLSSGLCLFIGVSGQLPQKFSLLGVSFDAVQKVNVGWFIFAVSLYMYLHFLFSASIEIAKWIHPFFKWHIEKRELLKHPAIDESDFVNIPEQVNEQDLNEVYAESHEFADGYVRQKLGVLYGFIYPKLATEVLTPLIVGATGLIWLAVLIIRTC